MRTFLLITIACTLTVLLTGQAPVHSPAPTQMTAMDFGFRWQSLQSGSVSIPNDNSQVLVAEAAPGESLVIRQVWLSKDSFGTSSERLHVTFEDSSKGLTIQLFDADALIEGYRYGGGDGDVEMTAWRGAFVLETGDKIWARLEASGNPVDIHWTGFTMP
jgi:hypothetical protein